MARFIYRMQSILDIKAKMEEQAKMEFAAARMHLDEEEEKLQILKNRKASYEDKGRELRKDSLKVMEIMENRDAIARMEEFIAFQMQQVRLAEEQLEEARYKLQVARQ
ncbi:MAG: flagellar FliJ family protein, partial [Lachnospiraceae bacterium]|nr:flagellar FliJ family protein [Lachnospiraceae bacterium]